MNIDWHLKPMLAFHPFPSMISIPQQHANNKSTYVVCSTNSPRQCVTLPHINISAERGCICDVISTKGKAKHCLNLSNFTEDALFRGQSVAAQRPEFNMFDSTAHKRISLIGIELGIKHLQMFTINQ